MAPTPENHTQSPRAVGHTATLATLSICTHEVRVGRAHALGNACHVYHLCAFLNEALESCVCVTRAWRAGSREFVQSETGNVVRQRDHHTPYPLYAKNLYSRKFACPEDVLRTDTMVQLLRNLQSAGSDQPVLAARLCVRRDSADDMLKPDTEEEVSCQDEFEGLLSSVQGVSNHFRGFTDAEITVLARRMSVRHFRSGEVLMEQGEFGEWCCIVLSGTLSVMLPNGPALVVRE